MDTCASFSAARVLAIIQAAAANAPVRFREVARCAHHDHGPMQCLRCRMLACQVPKLSAASKYNSVMTSKP